MNPAEQAVGVIVSQVLRFPPGTFEALADEQERVAGEVSKDDPMFALVDSGARSMRAVAVLAAELHEIGSRFTVPVLEVPPSAVVHHPSGVETDVSDGAGRVMRPGEGGRSLS